MDSPDRKLPSNKVQEMTYEEKLGMAQSLRENRLQQSSIPDKYRIFAESTTAEKMVVETSEGPCTAYRIEKGGRTAPSAAFVSIHGGGFVQGYAERDMAFARPVSLVLILIAVLSVAWPFIRRLFVRKKVDVSP